MIFKHFIFICILGQGTARDSTGVHFIQCFIENEQKPTFLMMNGLCWGKQMIVHLINELSKSGGRTSTSLGYEHKNQQIEDHSLFIVDLDCSDSEEILSKASSNKLFGLPYRWLILVTDATEHSRLSALRNSPVLADSDLVLAERIGDHFNLVELHKPSPNGSMISTPRGYYDGSLTDVRVHRELFRRRRDLMGHTLTMANVIQDSNRTQILLPNHDGADPQHDTVSKLSWLNAKLAFEMLNATPRYIFSYRWGYKVNGKWSGMIEDINAGRADLGTNCGVFNTDRHEVVTYTDVLAEFRVGFIFRQPPLPYVTNVFSLPFSGSVWAAIAVCSVLSTVAIVLATKWEVIGGMEYPTQLDGSIGDAMLLTMSAVAQQGCCIEPKRASGRMALWVVFTALMALYAAYSANIVVLLQAPSNSIKTVQNLATSKITLAANDVDYNYFVLSFYNDPVRLGIYRKVAPLKGKGHFYELKDGVERIRQGLFAFHSIVEPIYRRIENTFQEHEKCDLMEVDFMNGFLPHIPVKKGSPYVELLRVTFKQIKESGIKTALNLRMQVYKPRCTSRMASFSSVGLLDMKPVLVLMLYGIGVSVFVVIIEIIVFNVIKRIKDMQNAATSNMHLHNISFST